MPKQTLQLLNSEFTVHSFPPSAKVPDAVFESNVYFIGKTYDELSIVAESTLQLDSEEMESGWRALEVLGPLGFSLTGILSNISGVLAKADISIFAISTFDTDYILVKAENVNSAMEKLTKDGYTVIEDTH